MIKKILSASAAILIMALLPATCLADTPSWYPDDTSSFESFHNDGYSRVVDWADLFTDDEESDLNSRCESLNAQYGMDFVIYTDDTSYGIDVDQLTYDFYTFNGYGTGDDYSGSVMFICMEESNRQWYSAGTGNAQKYYTPSNIDDMDDEIEPYMRDGDYYGAMVKYIECLDVMYGGKVSASNMGFIIGVSAAIGAGIGAIVLIAFYNGMKKVKISTEANSYVIPGSFKIRRSRDYFLYSTVTRIKRGDDGGGRSGFSSGSSGGRSFSGGGRSF